MSAPQWCVAADWKSQSPVQWQWTCLSYSTFIAQWPIVWKSLKCQGFWLLSVILVKVRKMSGEKSCRKSGQKLFTVCCIFTFVRVFSSIVLLSLWGPCFIFLIIDNNTSTGMTRVPLNMGRSAANCQGFHGISVSGEWSACYRQNSPGDNFCEKHLPSYYDIHAWTVETIYTVLFTPNCDNELMCVSVSNSCSAW